MESLFLNTLKGNPGNRPPVWFMRQAGRILPNYQELRKNYSFHELMRDPDLCAEVTLMPVRDLGVDAAILFSDILVIPVAMGEEIEWTDHGPVFPKPLAQFDKPSKLLRPDASKLDYIYKNIDRILEKRDANTPLIGFCGAPLTTLCYMLQGISTRSNFPEAVKFFYANRKETQNLVDALTEFTIDYALHQVEHGVDAFQIFETHAGLLPAEMYKEIFLPAVEKIGKAIKEKGIPVIYFPKGIGAGLKYIHPDTCDFVSIDWQTDLFEARKMVHPSLGLQGNMDPRQLYASKEEIEKKLKQYIDFFNVDNRWVFNFGHGVEANSSFENLKFIVDWTKEANWTK